MKMKLAAVFFSLLFISAFSQGVCSGSAFDESNATADRERKILDCRNKFEGVRLEICINEAWLFYRQSKDVGKMRDYLTDKTLIDDIYPEGQENKRLWAEYWKKIRDLNTNPYSPEFKITNFDNEVAYCRFENAENIIRNLATGRISKEFPDALIVKDSKDNQGQLRSKIDDRKRELAQAESDVAKALKECNRSREEFCVGWEVPYDLLNSDVLQKCRPMLIPEMKQASELSKRAEMSFNHFKDKRSDEIKNAERCLAECRDLKPALDRLNALDPSPFNKCAENMLRQEPGPDAVSNMKTKLDSKIRDHHDRLQRIKYILEGANNALYQCDWNALDRIKSDALKNMPEENCIRNYKDFSDLRDKIKDLDVRKQRRLDEAVWLRAKMEAHLLYCENYMKSVGARKHTWQETWDANAVKKYNEDRAALDSYVKDAYRTEIAPCLQDLIARVNALPKVLEVPDKYQRVAGSWEFGRTQGPVDKRMGPGKNGTITLTLKKGAHGYIIEGPYVHPNESFWEFEGTSTIVFKHRDGTRTSTLNARSNKWDFWEGSYHPVRDPKVSGVTHYIKR